MQRIEVGPARRGATDPMRQIGGDDKLSNDGRSMTTPIYIRVRNPDNGVRVVEGLLQLGIAKDRLQAYGRRIPADLPVQATRWRGSAATLLPAMLVGTAGVLLFGGLIFGIDPWTFLLLAIIGAGVGALWGRGRLSDKRARFGSQRKALDQGDLMIVADLPQSDVQRVETYVSEQHPEMLVLGTDPGGSPPFP
jgi:hypothetical protein